MKTPALPSADDPCGKKIDHVARCLGQALAPFGFKRQGRRLAAAAGDGDERHWKIVQLQSGSWNEGPRGSFYVNLAVQFPALMRLSAQRPGMAWLGEHAEQVDEAHGQFRQRLGALQAGLPPEHPCARPAHSDEYAIRRDTDLAALANGVVRATCEIGLPWLQRHASLRALADFDGSLLGADIDQRIGAAVLIGDRARAQQILAERRGRFETSTQPYLDSVRTWLGALGLDLTALPTAVAAPKPSPSQLEREARTRAEEADSTRQAQALREAAPGGVLPPDALATAWLAEYAAAWRQSPRPLVDLPSGRDVAARDAAGREAVLLALLQGLVDAEAKAGPRALFAGSADAFETDESVRILLQALLPTLDKPAEATALAMLRQMTALVTRWRHELVTGAYPWGFAALAQWLTGPACIAHRKAVKPAIAAWLDAHRRFALSSFEQMGAFLATERAKPIDPANPLHDVLLEAREREAELHAKNPPPSDEELQRRIEGYPEQQMAANDRQAVALLRRALRRDDASGRLPVRWDGDDWGAGAQRAWDDAEPALRQALTPVLQHWLEGVASKPTQTWLRTLDGHIAALPPDRADRWRAWLLQQLSAFQHSSGRTEWATTGPRPGVGARLGEDSENLLLGLLWWAWRDRGLDAVVIQPPLQAVADGAWQRLPDVGARAPAVGGLVLRLLAGLGGAARQGVADQAQDRGASKQRRQASERALKDPLAR